MVNLNQVAKIQDGIKVKFGSLNQNLSLNLKNKGTEPVNVQIRTHETQIKDWELAEKAQELYLWYDLFNKEFFQSGLGVAVLSFDTVRINTLGHYVIGRNGIGIEHNINLNFLHLDRKKWQLLRTLLHEMLHQYQMSFELKDKIRQGNYHNRVFRNKAISLGIPCDFQGHNIEPPTDPFVAFLKQHGVEVDLTCEVSEHELLGIGRSTLDKFSCFCIPPINVRVADHRFSAKCNHCGKDFMPAPPRVSTKARGSR